MNAPELAVEIRYEIGKLRQVAAMSAAMLAVPATERRPWDAAAAAKLCCDLYNGFENLCKRTWQAMARPLPAGGEYHALLCEGFLNEPGLGGKLPDEIKQRLKKYQRLRHRVIHGYGHAISWFWLKNRCS